MGFLGKSKIKTYTKLTFVMWTEVDLGELFTKKSLILRSLIKTQRQLYQLYIGLNVNCTEGM